jgi:hypothetical protein
MASALPLNGDGTPYGLAAIRGEIDVLMRTPKGGRNDQLNRSSFALGRLIGGGELAKEAVRTALKAVGIKIGLDSRETVNTIESDLSAGYQEPRGRF